MHDVFGTQTEALMHQLYDSSAQVTHDDKMLRPNCHEPSRIHETSGTHAA